MKQPTISVALATFNGQQFLKEQLESIAEQTVLPDELVVGDDGSNDETLNILADFKRTAPFPVHVTSNESSLRFGRNFMETAKRCKSDWIAFCDQDDVWISTKIEFVKDRIATSRAPNLVLVTHAVQYVDQQLVPLNFNKPALIGDKTYKKRAHRKIWDVPGMSQVVRRDIIENFAWQDGPEAPTISGLQFAHDGWLCMVTNAIGSRENIGIPCVLYRRHTEAETSGNEKERTLRSVAGQAMSRGPETFEKLADFSEAMGKHLKHLASEADGQTAQDLLFSGDDLMKSAGLCRARAELRRLPGARARIPAFLKLILSGEYLAEGATGTVARAVISDALAIVAR